MIKTKTISIPDRKMTNMPNIIQVKREKQMSNKKLRNHLLRKVKKKTGIFNIITSDCHLSLNAAGTPSIAI